MKSAILEGNAIKPTTNSIKLLYLCWLSDIEMLQNKHILPEPSKIYCSLIPELYLVSSPDPTLS